MIVWVGVRVAVKYSLVRQIIVKHVLLVQVNNNLSLVWMLHSWHWTDSMLQNHFAAILVRQKSQIYSGFLLEKTLQTSGLHNSGLGCGLEKELALPVPVLVLLSVWWMQEGKHQWRDHTGVMKCDLESYSTPAKERKHWLLLVWTETWYPGCDINTNRRFTESRLPSAQHSRCVVREMPIRENTNKFQNVNFLIK